MLVFLGWLNDPTIEEELIGDALVSTGEIFFQICVRQLGTRTTHD